MDIDKETSKTLRAEEDASSSDLPSEKISNIFFKLQNTYTRHYKRHALIEKEVRLYTLIYRYINRVDKEALKKQPLEAVLIKTIFPKLNISPRVFKNSIFYIVAPSEERTHPFFIFSEQDIHEFYELPDHSLSSIFLDPTQKEFLAIIYWHQNKILNVENLCLPCLPEYSFQIPTLRILASSLTTSYGVACLREPSISFVNQSVWNVTQIRRASFELLNLSSQSLKQNQYLIALLDALKEQLSEDHNKGTAKLLGSLAKGNSASLSRFHDMIATVFLGHLYADTVTNSKNRVSIIYCKNIPYVCNLIKQVFHSSFMISSFTQLLAVNNIQNKRPIYTEYTLNNLYENLSVPSAVISELNGYLVNISVRSNDRDNDILKELARKKILYQKDDRTFKSKKYCPHMHYIHITDQIPKTIPKDINLIELLGDTPKDHMFSEYDATFIVLLSIFNFFYPTRFSIDIPMPIRYADDKAAVKSFKTFFFDDSTYAIPSERLDEIKQQYHDKDLSKSEYDTERIRIGKSIGIWDLGYTTSQDIEEAYNIWRSSDPDHIPEVKVIEIMRQFYSPLFYLKNNRAKSRLHPEEKEKNVKCFFGLALDPKSLFALANARKKAIAKGQDELTEESCIRYYERMIRNFQEVYPKIRSELETLTQMIEPVPPIQPPQ